MSSIRIDRRDCLKSLSQVAGGALAAQFAPRLEAAETSPTPTADCLILLWMAGGMAHTDTFDPKNYEPFSPGIESRRVLSTFPAIPTAADGIQFTEGLEEMASVMDEGSLIRTFTCPVTDAITHAKHQHHWHTGYLPPLSVAAPHLGAVIARTLGPNNPEVPPFININEPLEEAAREASAIRSFLTAGFLGVEHGPFMVPRPGEAAKQLQSHIGPDRHTARMRAYRELVLANPLGEIASSFQQEAMVRSMEQAYRLMNAPAARAFQLTEEPQDVYDYYNTSPFGLGCLLARRLVESGARFIEVHTPYKPFGYWDTHEDGHTTVATLKKMIDRPIAQLIRDLRDRKLLNRTLIVLASEFSRDVLIQGKVDKIVKAGRAAIAPTMPTEKHYGMHGHFADAGSILMWGGGIKKGYAYGETADEHPCKAISHPVEIEDVHATIYRALGISPKLAYEVERRPFYVTRDGIGKPILELFG